MQKLKDIFSDFNQNIKILESSLININLYKKTNKLEMQIKTDELISLVEISFFADYLKKRFAIEEVNISAQNESVPKIDEISKYIEEYLIKENPILKGVLKDISWEENENEVIAYIKARKGTEVISNKKIEISLCKLMFDIYGINKKVKFIENAKEDKEEYLKQMQQEQEATIKDIIGEIQSVVINESKLENTDTETKKSAQRPGVILR